MIYPTRLKKGDIVGIISPASTPDKKQLNRGISFIKSLGLNVKLGKNLLKKNGYLAGTDEERLDDFHAMIKDNNIKAIIFARGGYGTARLAPDIDFELIKNNPKIIWGYSDITFLHTSIRQIANLITFHGPMIVSVGKKTCHSLTKQTFNQLFMPSNIVYNETISPLHIINHGETSGQIVGGNLSLIVNSIGTPFEIDLKEKILFIEDVDEQPYKIDGMLNQLTQTRKLNEVNGIVVGDFNLPDYKELPHKSLNEIFTHYFKRLNAPVISGFNIGHCEPNIAIPLGAQAHLSTQTKTLTIEAGVK